MLLKLNNFKFDWKPVIGQYMLRKTIAEWVSSIQRTLVCKQQYLQSNEKTTDSLINHNFGNAFWKIF